MAKRDEPLKANAAAIDKAWNELRAHPLFRELIGLVWMRLDSDRTIAPKGFARIVVSAQRRSYARVANQDIHGFTILANHRKRADPAEWANIFAQALLHVGMNHTRPDRDNEPWRIACELTATDLLRNLGIGRRPEEVGWCDHALPGRSLDEMATALRDGGEELMMLYRGYGISSAKSPGWIFLDKPPPLTAHTMKAHSHAMAEGIRKAVLSAVESAGAAARKDARIVNPNSLAQRARSWFVANYPLLAALAAAFEVVEDEQLCAQYGISLGAVDPEQRRIYINPKFAWTYEGLQFVMAHELLHVGLRHDARRQGRDAFLWNVACDYVINAWLVEMGVGAPPTADLMLDIGEAFERDSAEAVYDRITGDLRVMRRLKKARTLRGIGACDMMNERPSAWWTSAGGCDLDTFYRRALAEGLDLHQQRCRGTLPGDLIEEINAIQQRPILWDVKLGQWLDAFFPPVERRRSFARASRRQSATPDIPRPVWERPHEKLATRTFGVVLDTSGSMGPGEIGRALGAIASYAMSREVPAVRLVQCDAGVHDSGFVAPESLLHKVSIRGRGGTVLQPAIVRLEEAQNFPKDAPILVITDGACDTLTIRREHAFLLPEGRRLPFPSRAPAFHFDTPH